MSFRPSLVFAVIPLICGGIVFYSAGFARGGLHSAASGADTGTAKNRSASFAVLSVDESLNDRRIRELFNSRGINNFHSESSVEIPVDDFGSLRMVPLDSFRSEIEEYDPRDDGFAQRMRAFFVHDGKRFFFFPLDAGSGNTAAALKKELPHVLGDTPYSFTVLKQPAAAFWISRFYAAACILSLYLSRSRGLYVFILPLLLGFVTGGFYIFILAAALAGIWELLRAPLGELTASGFYRRRGFGSPQGHGDYAGPGLRGLGERLRPYRANLLLVLLFIAVYVLVSAWWDLSPVLSSAALAGFALCYFLAVKAESKRAGAKGHILFSPVPMLPHRAKTFSLFPLLVPFGAAALLALLVPLLLAGNPFGSARSRSVDPLYFVSAEDYNRHIAFERSFSFRSLGAPVDGGFLEYYRGKDGLIDGSTANPESWGTEVARLLGRMDQETPRFPLEKLMDFLIQYSHPEKLSRQNDGSELLLLGLPVKEWISVAAILTICLFDWIKPGNRSKKRKYPLFGDKRAAA